MDFYSRGEPVSRGQSNAHSQEVTCPVFGNGAERRRSGGIGSRDRRKTNFRFALYFEHTCPCFLPSFLPSSYFHSSNISYCNRCFSPFIVVTWAFLSSKVDRLTSIYMVSVASGSCWYLSYILVVIVTFLKIVESLDKFEITSKNLLMVIFAANSFSICELDKLSLL